MAKWVEWVEPFGHLCRPVVSRMLVEDAIAERRAMFPHYNQRDATDDAVLDDFVVVYWGVILELPDEDVQQPATS